MVPLKLVAYFSCHFKPADEHPLEVEREERSGPNKKPSSERPPFTEPPTTIFMTGTYVLLNFNNTILLFLHFKSPFHSTSYRK